jgi:hypothetical protein
MRQRLAIVVDLEPRSAYGIDSDPGVCVTELAVVHRPAATVGITEDQAPQVATSRFSAACAIAERNDGHTRCVLTAGSISSLKG